MYAVSKKEGYEKIPYFDKENVTTGKRENAREWLSAVPLSHFLIFHSFNVSIFS